MTAGPVPPPTAPAAPAVILAALSTEDVGDVDREHRAVVGEATERGDLAPVLDMLERRRRAALASGAPQAHRRMLAAADLLREGVDIATEPWERTRRRLGL